MSIVKAVRRKTTIRLLNKTHVVGLATFRAEEVQPNSCDRPSCIMRVRIRFEPRVECAVRGDTNTRTRGGIGPNEETMHKIGDTKAESSSILTIRDDNSVAQPMKGQYQWLSLSGKKSIVRTSNGERNESVDVCCVIYIFC